MKKNAWIQSNGNYYYMDESGAMLTDTWIGDYYVDANGVWLKNYRPAKWMMTNGKWWYRNADGSYPVNCWKQISGIWYRFDNAGYMITGWSRIDNQWYYMNSSEQCRMVGSQLEMQGIILKIMVLWQQVGRK